MKNLNFVFNMIFISLFLISCGDIIDSELNTRTTILEYKYVKSDQEHSVIMPLKAGNVWYYKVSEFADDGIKIKNIYYDSVLVLSKIEIKGEIWFQVYFPFITKEKPVLMTNTDVGLWVKCDDCESKSFLWAKYPDIGKNFISEKKEVSIIDGSGNSIGSNIVTIAKSSGKENIQLSTGNSFPAIKYSGWFLKSDSISLENHFMDEYFEPDFGLLLVNLLTESNSAITKEFEYIDSIPGDDDNYKNYEKGKLPQIILGSESEMAYLILNSYDNTISFSDADISVQNDNPNVSINKIPLGGTRKLGHLEGMFLKFKVKSSSVGTFTFNIYIKCNLGLWYKINIVGECVGN